jgi:hypothetical protein
MPRGSKNKPPKQANEIREDIEENEFQSKLSELYKYFNDLKYNLVSLNKKFDILENCKINIKIVFKHNVKNHFVRPQQSEQEKDTTLEINADDLKFIEDNIINSDENSKAGKDNEEDLEFFKRDEDVVVKEKISLPDLEQKFTNFNQTLFDYKNYNKGSAGNISSASKANVSSEKRGSNKDVDTFGLSKWINKQEGKKASDDDDELSFEVEVEEMPKTSFKKADAKKPEFLTFAKNTKKVNKKTEEGNNNKDSKFILII